jgi:hypothetical protein
MQDEHLKTWYETIFVKGPGYPTFDSLDDQFKKRLSNSMSFAGYMLNVAASKLFDEIVKAFKFKTK